MVAGDFLRTRLHLIERFTEWADKHSFIIEAPRRYGKTSVVKEFIRQEDEKLEKHFNVLFFELEGTETPVEFCLKLSNELLSLYRMRNRMDQLQTFFANFWNAVATRVPKIQIPEFELELRQITRDFSFTEWEGKADALDQGPGQPPKNHRDRI